MISTVFPSSNQEDSACIWKEFGGCIPTQAQIEAEEAANTSTTAEATTTTAEPGKPGKPIRYTRYIPNEKPS